MRGSIFLLLYISDTCFLRFTIGKRSIFLPFTFSIPIFSGSREPGASEKQENSQIDAKVD